ncbi:hypothetical protein [Comamonas testosteroni]|uniref:hypothetical protein n=1 Tax=Comamonas testosteroni TaxID=285 RepID=UPI0015FCF50A|nr:hypothetical protein [Comamonas testosteroni]
MSDWDFLHDMHNEGYSADEIADAAALGYAPWQAKHISFGAQSKKLSIEKNPAVAETLSQIEKAIKAMEMLRQAEILKRPQFLA